jgi:hypothetical protein
VKIAKKQLVIIGIVILFISVRLSGCNDVSNTIYTEKNRFIGTWQNSTGYPPILEFSKDGRCRYGGNGTWELINGKLDINIPSYNLNDTYNYAFSNNDKTLMLTLILNNYTQVWTKQ